MTKESILEKLLIERKITLEELLICLDKGPEKLSAPSPKVNVQELGTKAYKLPDYDKVISDFLKEKPKVEPTRSSTKNTSDANADFMKIFGINII